MEHERLVRLCQDGDERALAELYQVHAPAAFKTAYLITGHRTQAEDVVQETFIQVIRQIHGLQQPSSLRSWLYKILTREAQRCARSAAWSRWLPFDDSAAARPDPHASLAFERLEKQDELVALRTAIKQLRPAHRIVVVLFYYTELTEQEIAHVANAPVGTIKSRLFYARRTLHQMLSQQRTGPVSPVSPPGRSGEEHG